MNTNTPRVLAIMIAVLSVWSGAASQLSTLLGQHVADIVVTLSALTVATLGAILGVIAGPMSQTQQVEAVRKMPGVENIQVNAKATPELAKLALDPEVNKVGVIPGAITAVEKTAAQAG